MSDDASALDPRQMALLRAYREVFEDHPAGRIVLADLMREAGMLSVGIVAGDPFSTCFNDGRRSLALTIIERLRWSEMELLQLARQHREPAYSPIPADAGIDNWQPEVFNVS